MQLIDTQARDTLREHHPEVATELDNLQRCLSEQALDPALLKLCSDFFEANLRNQSWSPPDSLSDLEVACLDVCEQFMVSVSNVTDQQVAALSEHLTADQLYNLMYGIYLIEASKRLELMLGRVLQ